MITFTEDEWFAEGKRLFGDVRADWRFECPSCSTSQSARDFVNHAQDKEKMKELIKTGIVGFSCIGRYVDGIGCNWTLGGLFKIHEVEVIQKDGQVTPVMAFASPIGGSGLNQIIQ